MTCRPGQSRGRRADATGTPVAGSINAFQAALIGIAGNAPTYSIAVTTATLVAVAGKASALALLVGGVLTLGILIAYGKLNELRPSAGAAYTWGTQHLGGIWGFMAGWAVLVSSTLFLVSACLPAGKATLMIFSPQLAQSQGAATLAALAWLLAVSAVVYRGMRLVGRIQSVLTVVELALIALIAAGLLQQHGLAAVGTVHPLGTLDAGVLAQGVVISVFFYWGWDVIFNVAEETRDTRRLSARAAHLAFLALMVLFTLYAAFATTLLTEAEIQQAGDNIVFALVNKALPAPFGYIAILTFLVSTIGALEVSIVSFSQTVFAQSRDGTMPRALARLHGRFGTPWVAVATISGIGAVLIALSAFATTVEEAIAATISASSVLVAYYYGVAGVACAKHFRGQPQHAVLYVWLPVVSVVALGVAGAIAFVQLDALATGMVLLAAGTGLASYRRGGRAAVAS